MFDQLENYPSKRHTIGACLVALIALSCQSPSESGSAATAETTPPVADTYVDEIKKLAANTSVKETFDKITALHEETSKNHILLTEIPAPPFKEAARASQFEAMLKAVGADSIWTDSIGNVLALRKGTVREKTTVIEAHMDTVFPEGTDVTVKHKGDTLYAPGIGDDTRGLAILLTLLKSMNSTGISTQGDVLFVGTVGEEGEGDLRGVKYLFEKGPKIDSYLAVDGGDIGDITNQGIGSHRYRITFKGPGGHSYGAYGIVNPHVAMARAMARWDETARALIDEGGAKTTFSVSITGGGTSVNSIPYESWVVVDMRSESPEKLTEIDKLLQDAVAESLAEVNKAKKTGEDLSVNIELIGDRPSGIAAPESPLVQRAMATAKYFGQEPSLSASSTNSNTPLALGVPAVTIGRGGKGGGGHSLNEWWIDDNGDQAIQYALLVLLAEVGIN
ncbi:M20/M25/M40 family metallo-hydrolase [Parapedobacter koreensis]|uniref:Peptidase dimerisation domain-containing protein n=1 Tax=Parapedobacter koreensis TaxID=332977 RepID=A0A1H7LGU7_9SPHI|nr:M20/M25/M40 family metallo-hydrolase [Parapedobacter koreensis]SEK98090.1 Peptidase dimerisation domain-containing protein [Parapedobacter koreensis]